MRRKLATLLIVAAVLLTGCSSPIDEGYVTEKQRWPGYYYTTMQCAAYNNKSQCTSWIHVQHYVPPVWKLLLKEPAGKMEEQKTGWAYVTQSTYDSIEVGQYYPPKE